MPDFADSNRVKLRYKRETTWGVLASSETFKELNMTSESLKGNINTITSETIRSDRNVSDITVVGGGAGGDIPFEVRYEDLDELFAGSLNADWVTTTVSAAFSARASAAVIKADSSSMSHLRSGMFVRNTGATASSTNDGDFQIATAVHTGGNSTVTMLDASTGVSAAFTGEDYAGDTKTTGRHLRNGTTKISYTVEKEFTDLSSTFREYAGMRVATLSLDLATQSNLTGAISFMGKSEVIASATIASAVTAASTNDVMNASGNVNRIWEGTQAISNAVFQNMTLELTNNTREQPQIGSDALAGVGLGRCEVTGSLGAYFENDALFNKYVNNLQSNLRFQVKDGNNNSYIISLPKIRYTDSTIAAGGPNADIVQELSWGAMVDDNGVYAIGIDALEG